MIAVGGAIGTGLFLGSGLAIGLAGPGVIVSYILASADLGDDPGAAVRSLDVPKRIQMDLLRGFSRDKLVNSFTEVIDKNYDDTSAFAADLATFLRPSLTVLDATRVLVRNGPQGGNLDDAKQIIRETKPRKE